MINIGIIGQFNNIYEIKRILKYNIKNKENYKVIYIDKLEDRIIDLNIDFDIIYIFNLKNVLPYLDKIRKLIGDAKYLILNTDLDENLRKLKNIKSNVITYGYKNKSTITVSSVNEEYIIIYVQRSIIDFYNNIIEPKEIKIYIDNINFIERKNNNDKNKIKKYKINKITSKNIKNNNQRQKILNINKFIGIVSILIILGIKEVKI